jgi:lipopolysaccharide transport system permease protein
VKNLFSEMAVLLRYRSLLWVMVRRELAARYAGSAAGMAWAFAQPLLTVAAYYLVFDVVFAMRLGSNAPTDHMGTFLIVGSLPWLAFCEGLSRGANSLVEAGGVLQKNALPPVLFVARSVLASWLVFAPLMVLMTLVYLPVSGLGWAVAAIPFLLLLQGVLVFLLAYLLAILTAALRDTAQVLGFVLSVGIFLSPVLFPLNLFPEAWRWVLFANPMSALVLAYQSVLLKGAWPDGPMWLIGLAWLLVMALLLNVLIRRSRDELVDWL